MIQFDPKSKYLVQNTGRERQQQPMVGQGLGMSSLIAPAFSRRGSNQLVVVGC